MEFDFSEAKNDQLFKERGVTFYNVIDSINENGILLNFNHPNFIKYPHQKILVVNINDYTYCVPYIIIGEKYFVSVHGSNILYLPGSATCSRSQALPGNAYPEALPPV